MQVSVAEQAGLNVTLVANSYSGSLVRGLSFKPVIECKILQIMQSVGFIIAYNWVDWVSDPRGGWGSMDVVGIRGIIIHNLEFGLSCVIVTSIVFKKKMVSAFFRSFSKTHTFTKFTVWSRALLSAGEIVLYMYTKEDWSGCVNA